MSRRIVTRTDLAGEVEFWQKKLRIHLYECVSDIVNDLEQRKGLGDEWEDMHPIQRREIADHWHALLCRRFNIDEK